MATMSTSASVLLLRRRKRPQQRHHNMSVLPIPPAAALMVAVVALLAASMAKATPPLNDRYEGRAAYQRRVWNQTIAHVYQPRHLAPHVCKYLTDAECRRQDDYQAQVADERRRLDDEATQTVSPLDQTHHRRRRLVDAPRTGEALNVLVLLIKFADHVDRAVPSREHFDALFNGDSADSETKVNAVGSIKEWLYYSSMGRYKVTFDVQDWFTVSETEAFYAAGVSGLRGADEGQALFKPALDALYNSGTYDFTKLDSGGWGTLDHLLVVHSGYGAEFGDPIGTEGCTLNMEADRMWSRGYAASLMGWQSSDYVYTVSNYAYAGAFDPDFCDFVPANMGILAHEFMHGFNAIDMYDQDANDEPIYLGGLGRYDIMSSTWGWNRNIAIPGHLSPFSRASVGWIEPIEIVTDGLYAIQAAEFSNQVYVIRQNYPAGEYLMIENRQPIKWDQDWPIGGLVIYHVDEMAPQQTLRGYPGHPNWPAEHYQVSVIQADGKYNIEKGESAGDKKDFWIQNMTLKSGGDLPNTDAYQDGTFRPTGIEITVTSPSMFIMSFSVTGLGSGESRSVQVPTTNADAGSDNGATNAEHIRDSNTTGGTLAWVLSVLGAVAALIGVIVVVL